MCRAARYLSASLAWCASPLCVVSAVGLSLPYLETSSFCYEIDPRDLLTIPIQARDFSLSLSLPVTTAQAVVAVLTLSKVGQSSSQLAVSNGLSAYSPVVVALEASSIPVVRVTFLMRVCARI